MSVEDSDDVALWQERGDMLELELHHLIDELGIDERDVLLEIAARMLHGQRLYGEFDLERDGRDFAQEAFEEDADGLVYRAAEIVRTRRLRRTGG